MEWIQSFLGAVAFYTIVPLPSGFSPKFERVASWSPVIGLLLGGILGLCHYILTWWGFPPFTCSVLIVALWLFLTGGLHLDGAMDTADGLAVADRERRLEVMTDSVSGAFGVMVAAVILLLKTVAIAEITVYHPLALMGAAAWGRWGQVAAIAFYPYLKPTGKGAFHRQNMQLPQDVLGGFFLLLIFSICLVIMIPSQWPLALGITLGGSTISLLSGFYFFRALGGHTGDTYGATTEWTEALLLSIFVFLS